MSEIIPEAPSEGLISAELITRMQVISEQPLGSRAGALTQVYEELRAELGSTAPPHLKG